MNAPTNLSEADIWERIIHPQGGMSKETAQRILQIKFTAEEQQQMHELAKRNQRGELTDDEEALLDHYCRVGTLLSVLKLRSQRVLKSRTRGS